MQPEHGGWQRRWGKQKVACKSCLLCSESVKWDKKHKEQSVVHDTQAYGGERRPAVSLSWGYSNEPEASLSRLKPHQSLFTSKPQHFQKPFLLTSSQAQTSLRQASGASAFSILDIIFCGSTLCSPWPLQMDHSSASAHASWIPSEEVKGPSGNRTFGFQVYGTLKDRIKGNIQGLEVDKTIWGWYGVLKDSGMVTTRLMVRFLQEANHESLQFWNHMEPFYGAKVAETNSYSSGFTEINT